MSYVDLHIPLNIVDGVDAYEMDRFGESIHDHPNRVKLTGSQWQAHDEIYANVIPLPIQNAQWLQQSSRIHIVGLDLLVGITL
jgi:hypothetical protein